MDITIIFQQYTKFFLSSSFVRQLGQRSCWAGSENYVRTHITEPPCRDLKPTRFDSALYWKFDNFLQFLFFLLSVWFLFPIYTVCSNLIYLCIVFVVIFLLSANFFSLNSFVVALARYFLLLSFHQIFKVFFLVRKLQVLYFFWGANFTLRSCYSSQQLSKKVYSSVIVI